MVSKFLAVIISLFLTHIACAQPAVLKVDKDRLIKVLDVVDFSLMQQVIELERLTPVVGDKADIFIMVNSPGGMVDPGLIFTNSIDRAKQRGYTIKCFSTVMAASMAFQILAHCSEVYALSNAKLLFHPVRIGGQMGFTQADLEYYAAEISKIETDMNQVLLKSFKFNTEMFTYHYARETMWEAYLLARETSKIQIISDIIGIDDTYQYRRQRGFSFGSGHSNIPPQLEYIKPESLQLFYQD